MRYLPSSPIDRILRPTIIRYISPADGLMIGNRGRCPNSEGWGPASTIPRWP